MSAYSGVSGTAKIGSTAIAEVTKWNFKPSSKNPQWVSSSTGGYTNRDAGPKDGSGAVSVKLDPTTPFYAVMDVGVKLSLKLYPFVSIQATGFYTVPAIIDDYDLVCDIETGEIVGADIAYSANGAWTNPTFS